MFPLFSLHLGVRFPPDFLRTAASEGTTCDGFRVSCGVRGVALNTEFQQTSLENEQEMDLTGSGSGPVSGAVSRDEERRCGCDGASTADGRRTQTPERVSAHPAAVQPVAPASRSLTL